MHGRTHCGFNDSTWHPKSKAPVQPWLMELIEANVFLMEQVFNAMKEVSAALHGKCSKSQI